ncbi:TlpA disulfide reductase family protein [Congregibacter variabilis]|uniref:TlpA disulfide reductase family protein n=1 Tax=Congregibacter variabilis TaxID=3081200 RepID=A0ABZ0I447_9GAMM|nr:TlpA disulfide reductase family protein [Congregibacter sp. IMCC43200]
MANTHNSTRHWLRGAALLLLITGISACEKFDSKDATSLDSTGSWTFVNYWAKWCKPCITEIPELNLLHQREGVRVLGVNYDGAQGDELQSQLDSLDVRFPTLATDPAARYGIDRPQVLPTTLVINPEGTLAAVLVGPQTEASLLAVAGISVTQDHDASSDQHSGNQ